MTATLILYGSRARGDARPNSDVDILLAPDEGQIGKPKKFDGLSLHIYPKNWLFENARSGDLFAYHIASEGLSIHCADAFLASLHEAFRWKASYEKEREIALAVATLLSRTSWGWNDAIQRRFFWAIRTLALTLQADRQSVDFSLASIDEALGLDGFSDLFEGRDKVTSEDCIAMGAKLLERYSQFKSVSSEDISEMLMSSGGIGLNTVMVLETEQAIDSGSLATYL
ncbi:nucleotidyltransferase domain-containing protein [Qipengyuania sp. Mu-71]|jgi:hypothetical protein|uniref:nucleotidyltransferase domain-containing protein n=1 Tax=Qipengyuania sp. Mu-71 TaxID=3121477 RepID=UPI002FE4E9D4